MARHISDILTEWFYRLPKGYALQPYNQKELHVLEQVLVEQGIDASPIIKSLTEDDFQLDQAFLDAKPVEEDKVKIGKYNAELKPMTANVATENLHEIFYAVALSYLAKNKSVIDPVNLDDFVNIIDKAGKSLANNNQTKQIALNTFASFKTKYLDDENNFTKSFYKYWNDASSAAQETKMAIDRLYEPTKYNYVARVNVRGQGGSEVADNLVNIDIINNKDNNIYVSLKYGPAQFGSLSLNKILKKLYGFEIEIDDTKYKGLLSYMYNLGGDEAKAIDKSLKTYIKNVNDFVEAYPDEKVGGAWDLWNNIEPADPDTMNYDKWRAGKMQTDQSYAYRKIYMGVMKLADRQPALNAKKQFLNPAIDAMMDIAAQFNKPGELNDFSELIAYILRTDMTNPDATYLYVALGGKKLVSIPSYNMIKAKTKQLSINLEAFQDTQADYVRNMEIIGDGEVLAIIPLKFRFADGQWTSDLAQKGPAPTFNHPAFEDFFGAAGSTVKGEI